eukprot:gnl/TRDRNA2_/TRDRNA2_83193_c0_seq2.p2 gnl/TRDRNA2_/TRDRNA2_83193_c0~~gnl/TRDRNA2_/TRDRNA2_83193_c0_seq2.p2  ORF type:complete len:121 (+),score=30.26 gnl/TRDRNA2_/TRDRNA2_83193_c0_seq2:115-477(+)
MTAALHTANTRNRKLRIELEASNARVEQMQAQALQAQKTHEDLQGHLEQVSAQTQVMERALRHKQDKDESRQQLELAADLALTEAHHRLKQAAERTSAETSCCMIPLHDLLKIISLRIQA